MSNQQDAQAIAIRAIEIAREHHHEMATLEHVLAALLEHPQIQDCFRELSVDIENLASNLKMFFNGNFIGKSNRPNTPIKTADFETLFVRTLALSLFGSASRRVITPLDILLHLTQLPHEDSYAGTLLLQANVTSFVLKKFLSRVVQGNGPENPVTVDGSGQPFASETEPKNRKEAEEYVRKFARNLNEEAAKGKIDPVIGRVEELDATVQTLARRVTNNVIYVGNSGTGKTVLAEGLALNIVRGDVPELLKKSTVWSLEVSSLVAGTKFRGDLEERMKFFLSSLVFLSTPLENHDPKCPEMSILFIDEIHTIMEAGSSGTKGSLDVGNMLKPALAKGTLRCIGSTTLEEYRKYFEKDRALVRRFKKILIEEPSPETTKKILRGIRNIYEEFHDVHYTDDALDAAVDLTHRYVHSAFLPDKAISIIDQAGARQRITDIETRLAMIDVIQIENEVAKIAKFPAKQMEESESEKLLRLESDLLSTVFGQPKAINVLTNSVMISRAGLREPNLPAGMYLFLGPSGVGKTEVARQLAKTLMVPLVKFDMSEYMEKHSVSRLIGSPPGYVGFGDGAAGDGLLINAVDTHPYCVLLLDEIEKAHEDVYNILLQVMDDGILTSGQGKPVKFNNVILIMTTNAGVNIFDNNAIGFERKVDHGEIDDKAIQRLFKPEFRNRLDAIIKFERLKSETMIRIVDKFIVNLQTLTNLRGVEIEVSAEARQWLAEKGYDPQFGARPLTRVINEYIKLPLSREMLFGNLSSGGIAKVDVNENKISVIGLKKEAD